MFRNYFKVAWRNVWRNKVFSFINIVGLAVGLACFLLITLYVRDELGYDRHHQNASRIYRMTRTFLSQDGSVSLRLCSVAPPFGPLVKSDFPEASQVVRMLQNSGLVRYGEHVFTEQNIFFAEESIFKLFSFDVLSGNPDQALVNPFSIMLSRPMAEKYFGSENPLGKTIQLDRQFDLTVTGVYEPQPAQSHFHPDFLLSFSTMNDPRVYGRENLRTNWGNNSFATYLLLPENYDISRMEKAFPAFQNKHIPANDGQKASSYSLLGLQKLTDIHLRSHTDDEIEPGGDIRYVYLFSAIGLFILIIACINYMNLATARSAGRAKEVGLRKAVGAIRGQLIGQFLSESVLLAALSLGIAVVLLLIGLPLMNELTQKQLRFIQLIDPVFVSMLLVATLLTGLVAGSYPAFVLTAFQPIAVLKGRVTTAGMPDHFKNGRLRQVLVVTQFAIAVMLIISTAVVFSQLTYIQNYELGYKKAQVVLLPVFSDSTLNYETIKQELKSSSTIADAARSSRVPSGRLLDSQGASVMINDSLTPSKVTIKMLAVDHEFIPTYGMKLAAGRNFSRAYTTDDSAAFVLNETAVAMLGWSSPQQAINKEFRYGGQNGRIIGVTTNFHFESLHQQVAPLVLFMAPQSYNFLSVHVAAGQLRGGLAHIEQIWKRYFPDRPFSYQFLDQRFGRLYATEQTQQTLFGIFAGIAILISCLGLFGLSIFIAEQRTKEIGVRKVLGATTPGLVALLARDLMKLVLVAIVLASPVAWWAMTQWLSGFAYPAPISPWIFILTGLAAVLIAFLTVAYQSIKAALMNPVKSLRSE